MPGIDGVSVHFEPSAMELPSDIVLRAVTDDDAAQLMEMVFTVLREYGLKPDPAGTDADLSSPDTTYRQAGGCFDVLVRAGTDELVGSVGLLPTDPGSLELRKMYLNRTWRGRGLGRFLLQHAIRRTRELGYARLYLETASVLQEAIKLYERSGFRPCHEGHLSPRCDRRMELLLG